MRILLLMGAAAAAALTACTNAPGLQLRDNYLARDLLEPGLTLAPVRRDDYGNAIIEERRPLVRREWPTYQTAATGPLTGARPRRQGQREARSGISAASGSTPAGDHAGVRRVRTGPAYPHAGFFRSTS